MNNRKYPLSLFLVGYIMNVIFHFFWLFFPGLILALIGMAFKPCAYVALFLLALDLVLSFIEQMNIRRAFLEDSDNPDFREFQDAISKDGDWRANIHEIIENKIQKNEKDSNSDSDDENKDE